MNGIRQAPAFTSESVPLEGSTRISVAWQIPAILRGFGVDITEALDAAGIRRDIFEDPESLIEYAQFQRLLVTCERLTNCDHFGMLAAQHTRLADLGAAGRAAICGATAGEGLLNFTSTISDRRPKRKRRRVR